ncbi:MAG TPA: hypothetical protein VHE37_17325, partial [Nevskiaceae bacterium]|nr:hypothetical protein [Nevskiaceae bacterium]
AAYGISAQYGYTGLVSGQVAVVVDDTITPTPVKLDYLASSTSDSDFYPFLTAVRHTVPNLPSGRAQASSVQFAPVQGTVAGDAVGLAFHVRLGASVFSYTPGSGDVSGGALDYDAIYNALKALIDASGSWTAALQDGSIWVALAPTDFYRTVLVITATAANTPFTVDAWLGSAIVTAELSS